MEIKDQNSGFTILCDQNGLIRKMLRDSIGLAESDPVGKMLFAYIDVQSRHLFLDFIARVKDKKVAFLYQIDLILNKTKHPFVFGGVFSDPDILIVASANRTELYEMINQIQEINNELMTRIRLLEKEKYENDLKRKEEDNRVYNDITGLYNDMINLQRELAKKNSELTNMNELKNRFLGMAAHDLRNPIGIISSYSEFLMNENNAILSDEHKEFLEIMNSSAQYMHALIDDLLDVSKIEAGKIDLHLELFAIEQLVARVVTHNRILSKRKSIRILFSDSAPGLIVFADSLKLEQVFTNLISNAIKFSESGTTVRVKIAASGNSAVVSVHNNGKSIPENEIGKLFKPFQETSVKSTAGEKSTGLGLMIAKRIVEAHKGSIRVESQVNSGTTFIVELPSGYQHLSQLSEKDKNQQNI